MVDWDDYPELELDPLSDLAALWTAGEPEELWRALVVHSGRSTTHHWEALHLFRRHHEDGTPGSLTTALLLCTDRRWDRCTARLIAGIVDTGILGEDEFDEMAGCFLWSDVFRFHYPVSWIGTEWVQIDLEGVDEGVESSVVHLDSDTPVPNDRAISPPLRRWAAGSILRADPIAFDTMRGRALELGGLDGGAIVSGMLDAMDALDEDLARRAIDLGLDWPRGSVRLLALDLLAARDPEAAKRRAAGDPDKKVRSWKPHRGRGSPSSVAAGDPRRDDSQRTRRGPPEGQASLFAE